MENLKTLNIYQKMMLRCKTKKQSLDYMVIFYVMLFCSFSLQAKFIPTCILNCFTQLLVFYTHCQYGTDGKTLIFFIINGTAHLRCFKYFPGAFGNAMIAMVTCHDLGTDKTLLDSGLGAVAINIKLAEVLTITYHLTNLLLVAPEKK